MWTFLAFLACLVLAVFGLYHFKKFCDDTVTRCSFCGVTLSGGHLYHTNHKTGQEIVICDSKICNRSFTQYIEEEYEFNTDESEVL